MTPPQRKLFRLGILQVLDANRTRFGIGAPAIVPFLRPLGFDVDVAEVEKQLDYLRSAGCVEETGSADDISPELQNWKLTKRGSDELAKHGYA